MNRPRTPEFDRIAKAFGWSRNPARVGDDAARLPDGRFLCCDALAEGVHFRLDWSSPQDVGWKAVAQNVSDIFAMGGIPTQAVWSVGMGAKWDDRVFAGLCRGAKAACAEYGCEIVGGDTVRTTGPGFVSLTLLGDPATATPWLRSGARIGDAIVLAGEPGWSAAGLAALVAGRGAEPVFRKAARAHRRPTPSASVAAALRNLRVTSAIDLSDGLSSELRHLSTASGTAFVVDPTLAAPSASLARLASELDTDPMEWVLHGGEDHCLLLTLPKAQAAKLPAGTTRIGTVEAGSGVWTVSGSRRRKLVPRGWVHH